MTPNCNGILFVDDDELLLRSIDRVLRRHAQQASWELHFISDGDAALELLQQKPFDVVLADAHMPRMSGTSLLRRIQESHPGIVRILLSGHTGLDVLRTALPVAHQFIAKPCDAQLLKTTLENACGLRGILKRPELQALVGGSNELTLCAADLRRNQQCAEQPAREYAHRGRHRREGHRPLGARPATGQFRLLRSATAGEFESAEP